MANVYLAKPRNRSNRFAPLRQARALTGIYSDEEFHALLERERALVDRSSREFSLLVFDVEQVAMDGVSMERLARIITRRVRSTDVVGWYRERDIGIFLPDTPAAGAWKLAEDLCHARAITAAPPFCRVHTYALRLSDTGGGKPEELEPVGVLPEVQDVQRIVENVRLMAKERRLQVIGMTGSVPNEGTSTVATAMALMMTANFNSLATSFAIDNSEQDPGPDASQPRQHEILLIDAQWRHPSVHNFLGMPLGGGLGELLADEILPHTAIKRISASDLKLITAGQKSWNPSAPIDFERFKSLLSYVRPYFEFVVLDIPPVLRFAEAITLCKQCDGLILVVRARQTRWEVVAEAKRLLEKSGINILGAVLNRRKFYIPERIYRRL